MSSGATAKRSAIVANAPRYRIRGTPCCAVAANGSALSPLVLARRLRRGVPGGRAGPQLVGTGKRRDVAGPPDESLRVLGGKLLRLLRAELLASLPQHRVDDQAATHPDPPVDPPDGQLHAGLSKDLVPGEHVLIDAVDKRPIQVEEQCRHRFRHRPSVAERAGPKPSVPLASR